MAFFHLSWCLLMLRKSSRSLPSSSSNLLLSHAATPIFGGGVFYQTKIMCSPQPPFRKPGSLIWCVQLFPLQIWWHSFTSHGACWCFENPSDRCPLHRLFSSFPMQQPLFLMVSHTHNKIYSPLKSSQNVSSYISLFPTLLSQKNLLNLLHNPPISWLLLKKYSFITWN